MGSREALSSNLLLVKSFIGIVVKTAPRPSWNLLNHTADHRAPISARYRVTPPDILFARYQGPISARFSFLGAPRYRASAEARFSPDFQTSPDFQARFLTRFSLDFQTSPDSHSIFKHHPILTRFSSPISHSILTRFSNITRFSLDFQTSPDSHPIFKPDFSHCKTASVVTRVSN